MRRPLLWTLVALSALAAFLLVSRPARDSHPATPTAEEPDARRTILPTDTVEPSAEPAATDPRQLPAVLVDPRVRVEKAKRRLTVFSDGKPVKGYRIALGRAPRGDKEVEGDGRTPEGTFYVCSRNPKSRFHLSLGLSYPNEEDAQRGLKQGLISKREYKAITGAIHRMQQPPWKTPLGGEIMIHGSGSSRGDWTLGCIALDDEDIDELFKALPLGAEVEIVP